MIDIDTTPTTPTVRVLRTHFLEDDAIAAAGIPTDDVRGDDYECDDTDDAVRVLQREGVTFAATGTDWAADPDGSYIVNYATAERVETTAHLYGFTDAERAEIIERVG